ncbi:MAG: hypothetical protein GY832_25255, partial [Chloroflexi bacterium]|nr:hypothetical protein [Chloroflexota bacterium]
DLTAPEMLRERMRRINIVHRRRIAILTGEADAELAVAIRAAANAATLAEAANVTRSAEAEELDEFSPDNTEDDAVWTVTFSTPQINACLRLPVFPPPPIPLPPPEFIPGRRFATYAERPALRAQAPRFRPPTSPPCSKSPLRPNHCSPLEMVLWYNESVFLKHFLDIITNALFEELGMPPYSYYIAKHLPMNFSLPPSEQGPASVQPVSIEPVSAEPTPAHAPEPEESTIEIIEWDDP